MNYNVIASVNFIGCIIASDREATFKKELFSPCLHVQSSQEHAHYVALESALIFSEQLTSS